MQGKLSIWGRKTSSNVQALMWCVAELNLAYERYDIGHKFGGNDTPEFLEMNPNGTVPVLRDNGGEAIWETGAILRYLATQYGTGDFWPQQPQARANVDKWAEWAKINIAGTFTGPIFWRVVRTAAKDRDEKAIASALNVFHKYLQIAENQLTKQPFLAGEAFTLADIQFGHVLYRYFDIAIERASFPAVEQYYQNLTQRPAFAEHVMVSYDDLRAE
ncbi:glutathione S-transferase family protein [Rouxiella badensis]|jgi:glutathione S-transferase|uniref:Glutathione S-transferase n=1 Tax=Rouxiella badensis TaxID=1646377 RepID=A0A1X0WHN5_9GAMM|nr:glutathione S-transferase family protein [Rouxiella badensis]ORJ26279.1 glutathione S-transferase [Rouxiella badensis]WAT03522.1 glutathione S-transferase family protein [Rouxiella badensis]WAT09894.1 glutathione S-transferase family protein [Rouxiella badensis]